MTFTAAELPCEPYSGTIPGSMFAYDINIYCVVNDIFYLPHEMDCPDWYIISTHIDVSCQAGHKCWWSSDRAIYDLRPDILEACQLWADNHFEMPLWRFLNATLEDTP